MSEWTSKDPRRNDLCRSKAPISPKLARSSSSSFVLVLAWRLVVARDGVCVDPLVRLFHRACNFESVCVVCLCFDAFSLAAAARCRCCLIRLQRFFMCFSASMPCPFSAPSPPPQRDDGPGVGAFVCASSFLNIRNAHFCRFSAALSAVAFLFFGFRAAVKRPRDALACTAGGRVSTKKCGAIACFSSSARFLVWSSWSLALACKMARRFVSSWIFCRLRRLSVPLFGLGGLRTSFPVGAGVLAGTFDFFLRAIMSIWIFILVFRVVGVGACVPRIVLKESGATVGEGVGAAVTNASTKCTDDSAL